MNNYIKEIKERSNVVIEEPILDLNLLNKRTTAKTPSGLMLKYAKQFRDNKNFLMAKLFQELYTQVRNMEVSEQFKAKQWRGKSGVNYQIKPDSVISIRFRRNDIGEKPIEVRTEMFKEQINRVRWAINQLNENKLIPTSKIAEKVYNKQWKSVFSNRPEHTILVEILNYLEYRQEIKYYRSGKVKVLNQMRLEK